MPVHDWTKATPGMFPDFHQGWLTFLKAALNVGRLPRGYSAMAEQRTRVYTRVDGGKPREQVYGPDVLTLTGLPRPAAGGGAVGVAEPRAARRVDSRAVPDTGRVVTVRHAAGDRVVAVIEVVSPANKDRAEHVGDLAGKVPGLVRAGVHVVVLDILPPGPHDPDGLHGCVWPELDTDPDPAPPPPDQPLTFAGYRAGDRPTAFLNYAAVGQPLPDVPLYLDGGVFVDLPVEATYMQNFHILSPDLRAVLEGPPP